MENPILKEIFKLGNRKDVDTYCDIIKEDIKTNNRVYPIAFFLEAMHLYNMYHYAIDNEEFEGNLYPYKLVKMIEIGNEMNIETPIFTKKNGLYTYNGTLKINELNSVLGVLIDYANTNFLCKLLVAVFPYIDKISFLENIYIALGIMKFKGLSLPPKIGQYFTADYLQSCGEMDFFQSARDRLKMVIALEQLPEKAKAMYFQLDTLYKCLEDSAIFDFGVICLQCFKIIEISTKELIKKVLINKSNEELFDMLPQELMGLYKRESFKIDRLEIGKIYFLLENLFEKTDSLSVLLRNLFENSDDANNFISYFHPKYINRYRNAPAHGSYLSQEDADFMLRHLNGFINDPLYKMRTK